MEDQNLKNELKLERIKELKEERTISNKKYAVKLVERGFFALVGLLCVGVVTALIKLVLVQ